MKLAEEVATMAHAFPDSGRKDAVRELAGRVAKLEERIDENARALAFLLGDDSGLSSQALLMFFLGIPKPTKDHPWDAGDFGRCVKVLEVFPAWRERLDEAAKISKVWAALIPRWAEFEQLYKVDRRKLTVEIDETIEEAWKR